MTRINVWDDGRVELPTGPGKQSRMVDHMPDRKPIPSSDPDWKEKMRAIIESPEGKARAAAIRARRRAEWELLGCTLQYEELRSRILAHNDLLREERVAFLSKLPLLAQYLGVTTDKLKREVPGGNSANRNRPKDAFTPKPPKPGKGKSNPYGKR